MALIKSAVSGAHQGITFTVFTAHMVIGIIFVTLVGYGFMRLYYRNMQQLSNADPPEIAGVSVYLSVSVCVSHYC